MVGPENTVLKRLNPRKDSGLTIAFLQLHFYKWTFPHNCRIISCYLDIMNHNCIKRGPCYLDIMNHNCIKRGPCRTLIHPWFDPDTIIKLKCYTVTLEISFQFISSSHQAGLNIAAQFWPDHVRV